MAIVIAIATNNYNSKTVFINMHTKHTEKNTKFKAFGK